MTDAVLPCAAFVEAAGGTVGGVRAVMRLHRLLWDAELQDRFEKPTHRRAPNYRVLSIGYVEELLDGDTAVEELLELLVGAKVVNRDTNQGNYFFTIASFQPLRVAHVAFGALEADHQLRFFLMRDIRETYRMRFSPSTANLLHRLSKAVNQLSREADAHDNTRGKSRGSHKYLPRRTFLDTLGGTLSHLEEDRRLLLIRFFLEVCTAVDYLRLAYRVPASLLPAFDLRATVIDAEYLLSNLFGLATGMRGLDELFGGGGPILREASLAGEGEALEPERPDPEVPAGEALERLDLDDEPRDRIGGRAILLEGKSGTGKSMLTLQLAVEVARKGGLAWLLLLEQSAEECMYTLESIQALPKDGSFRIAVDNLQAEELLNPEVPGQGGLVLLRGAKESYEAFVENILATAARMHRYPIRLVIVDPINSIVRESSQLGRLRTQLVDALDLLRELQANVLLVAEASESRRDDLLFERNVADVVIHLSVEEHYRYAQRYIEITKSRLQREQRGKHPFGIVPGQGITIYPSAAAVSARIQTRARRGTETAVTFGQPTVDRMIGARGLVAGDCVVLQGPSGSYKTPLGIAFLLGSDAPRSPARPVSLWVLVRDDEATARRMLNQMIVPAGAAKNPRTDIRICVLPAGHVQPGFIIQKIQDALRAAQREDRWIDRVMVDDVAHWELSCPYIRDDETFGDTLVEFLRRHDLTCLFTCAEAPREGSALQSSIVDRSDCVITLDQFEVLGTRRVLMRVARSRGMRHSRESFEVGVSRGSPHVTPSLLRLAAGGQVSQIGIRLFLNAETRAQDAYHERLMQALTAVLSGDIAIEPQAAYLGTALDMGAHAFVKELQVLQVDEFELPWLAGKEGDTPALHPFPDAEWGLTHDWSDFLPGLEQRVRTQDGFFAVPFFENVSFLVYRADDAGTPAESWSELAQRCADWEDRHAEGVYFDFGKQKNESYNCLFLQILASLEPPPQASRACRLAAWLQSDEATEAALLLRTLCARSYRWEKATRGETGERHTLLNPDAKVWHLWYSTVPTLLDTLSPDDAQQLRCHPTPGEICVAGEWYLAVSAYSVAPDVGLDIVRMLTKKEAEIDRIRSGVGLPTRAAFYNDPDLLLGVDPTLPNLTLPSEVLARLINGAIRRSDFGCYHRFTESLAYHLQKVIEVPDDDVESRVRELMANLQGSFRLLAPDGPCAGCRRVKSTAARG